jgi:hypothetical protein
MDQPTQGSWLNFQRIIDDSPSGQYIWRGQRDPAWPLASSFERRVLQMISLYGSGPDLPFTPNFLAVMDYYLADFKHNLATYSPIPTASTFSRLEWYSLGRHNGLTTRLLDWTDNPWVALAFALYDFVIADAASEVHDPHAQIAVYRLSRQPSFETYPPLDSAITAEGLHIVQLLMNNVPTIGAQNALFTWLQSSTSFDIKDYLQVTNQSSALLQLLIRRDQLPSAIRELDRRAINFARLYPDPRGAALAANVGQMLRTFMSQDTARRFGIPGPIGYLP